MTSDMVSFKEASGCIRRSAVNNHTEYLNKTIILFIYSNLPHTSMQKLVFLNKRYGVAVLLLQWKETNKKQCVFDSFTNKIQCIAIILELKYFLIFF